MRYYKELRNKNLNIKVKPSNLAKWKKCSQKAKISLSRWIETNLNSQANREI